MKTKYCNRSRIVLRFLALLKKKKKNKKTLVVRLHGKVWLSRGKIEHTEKTVPQVYSYTMISNDEAQHANIKL